MSSSSSEEQVDLSGDELDLGDELTPLDTSKFTQIFEKEMQVDISAMVPPSGKSSLRVFLLSLLIITPLI